MSKKGPIWEFDLFPMNGIFVILYIVYLPTRFFKVTSFGLISRLFRA